MERKHRTIKSWLPILRRTKNFWDKTSYNAVLSSRVLELIEYYKKQENKNGLDVLNLVLDNYATIKDVGINDYTNDFKSHIIINFDVAKYNSIFDKIDELYEKEIGSKKVKEEKIDIMKKLDELIKE